MTGDDLDRQWERIKRAEQAEPPHTAIHPLGQLPGNLPALQRAQKLISRARRKGVTIDCRLPATATDAGHLTKRGSAVPCWNWSERPTSTAWMRNSLAANGSKILAETGRTPTLTATTSERGSNEITGHMPSEREKA